MSGHDNPVYRDDSVISIRNRKESENGNDSLELNNQSDFKPDPNKETNGFQRWLKENERGVAICGYTLIHVLVVTYFSYAIYYFLYSELGIANKLNGTDGRCHGMCGLQWCDGFGMLIILMALTYVLLFYYYILKPTVGKKIYQYLLSPLSYILTALFKSKIVLCLIFVILAVALGLFLYVETIGAEERLMSLICPVFFFVAGYAFSTDRKAIKWRPVILGIICQFLLGVLCIRWEVGRSIFQCIGDKVAVFLSYTNDGTIFVFGEEIIKKQIFAFAILPVIFFFSFCISILYYIGAMQWTISKLGWILQQVLGTTVCESVNAAANIFLGMSEAPLLIRPYIKLLTASELHAIMVSGFATVSGTVLAAYMSFGASPAHLITSSVMAAPATLAMSKLYFPETEESKTKSDEDMQLEKSEDSSLLDAASNGASIATQIVLGIVANLVAFVAFIAFINGVVNWLGYLIGLDITFEWLFAKLFIPVSWSMGIPWKECDVAARVIASKSVINEFVAYQRLGAFAKEGLLSARSQAVMTYAICGFANPSSLGILMGSLGVMAPERKTLITKVAVRAFIVGTIVCFISASFAGLLLSDEIVMANNK